MYLSVCLSPCFFVCLCLSVCLSVSQSVYYLLSCIINTLIKTFGKLYTFMQELSYIYNLSFYLFGSFKYSFIKLLFLKCLGQSLLLNLKKCFPALSSHDFPFIIQHGIWTLAAVTEKDLSYIHLPLGSMHIL